MNLIELKNLAREIENAEDTIAALEHQTSATGNEWVTEQALQGQRLLHVKAQMKHGDWLPWFNANLQKLSYDRAVRYMRVAANLARTPDLAEATSLYQALALCEKKNKPATAPRHWPSYTEANSKFTKCASYVKAHPVSAWPVEAQDRSREILGPLVKALWPEKFA